GEANSLRSDSLPSFSSLQQKFKAPHRAGTAKPSVRVCGRKAKVRRKTSEATNRSLMGMQTNGLLFLP
ncbi:hypothetical protein, partial [Ralstonia pseudosolanacearum]|uniref:hypothetical protein n=1 Tax=Ralstonia pseudosolanacearum TaxID=1310165 RepID=UPI001FF750FA